MLNCEQSKNSNLYSGTVDPDRSVMEQDFYSPLCRSGYLTPLQRKKLREKRSLDLSDCTESVDLGNLKKIKRSRISKVKKVNISKRSQKRHSYPSKAQCNLQQVQCTVAKIFNRTVDDSNNKEKKFFKSSPTTRLERANFTMPLVLRKTMLNCLDRNTKVLPNVQRKRFSMQECKLDCQNDNVVSCENENYVSPCIIRLVPSTLKCVNSNSTSDNLEKALDPAIVQISSSSGDVDAVSSSTSSTVDSNFDFEWLSDDIFLQRQLKARSLKKVNILNELNSAAKNKEINDNLKASSESVASLKLYPIFNFADNKKVKSSEDFKSISKHVVKCVKDSSKGGEQMIIDAGQRDIGPKICNTCNMLYTIGQEEDENLHSSYHNMFLINLKFPGWKKENVIGEYCDGRVIMVRKNDRSWKMKKIEDVLLIANRDLGFPTAGFPSKPDLTFILFISIEKRVAGCVVAESIYSGSKVLLADSDSEINELTASKEKVWRIGDWYSSSESMPAVCGVNRIWVSREYRRHKVASRMIDCLRCNFIHGHVVSIQELAFTDPSPDGRQFAAAYTGTNNFLVYK